jgi:serine protease Do
MVRIILSDGRRVEARSLGANNGIDSGMMRIIEPGVYPFVPVGSSKKLSAGQWVVALGHPGGYVPGRPPVVRLGRVLLATDRAIDTDSTLISGDSGGPVFDLDGRLIGINSRIGPTTTENIHVPIDTFVDTWDRLAKGEEWVDDGVFVDLFLRQSGQATLGLTGITDDNGVRVTRLREGPAKRNGLLVGDIISKLDGDPVRTAEDLALALSKRQPHDSVMLTVLRDGRERDILMTLEDSNPGRMRRMRGG